jgi:hypothetical protein
VNQFIPKLIHLVALFFQSPMPSYNFRSISQPILMLLLIQFMLGSISPKVMEFHFQSYVVTHQSYLVAHVFLWFVVKSFLSIHLV